MKVIKTFYDEDDLEQKPLTNHEVEVTHLTDDTVEEEEYEEYEDEEEDSDEPYYNYKCIEDIGEGCDISYVDVNDEASVASFICFAHSKDVPIPVIATRSCFTEEEVISILREAKELNLTDSFIDEFLK